MQQKGFVKVRHLRAVAAESRSPAADGTPAQKARGSSSSSSNVLLNVPEGLQKWVVMDSAHDGAWLRKRPNADVSPSNIVHLIPNGDHVAGDFVLVRSAASGAVGYVKFESLQEDVVAAKSWKIHCKAGESVNLCKQPREARSGEEIVGKAKAQESVRGEYVYVFHKDKRAGFVKRKHLSALASILR
eukprot:TRINITY_DN45341_c0_g1_i1.p1 TRINITY_DN45341_c0_g1~~TRINITY_DN45341_c0_g1_i1.p1  ORF type:complete len:187 (-),score=42.75 TRINITY_DN45341_c0_g1_i1:610-1170(-)